MTAPEKTSRFVVRGRVQGVGFRWFVLRAASELELEGYVRNQPDGSVEVLARGLVEAMGRLESSLAQGPSSAHVERVEKEELPHDIKLPKPFGVK
jgi:acylphosphatase